MYYKRNKLIRGFFQNKGAIKVILPWKDDQKKSRKKFDDKHTY